MATTWELLVDGDALIEASKARKKAGTSPPSYPALKKVQSILINGVM